MINVVNDLDGSSFDSLSSLLNYDLIIFSNTSGSSILDSSQRANFEQYIQNGGNLLGIHAASDTYRHSTANGSNTGVWDFYAETLGGSVQQGPNHVSGTPYYEMDHLIIHPSLYNIPNPWGKNEEYYYWENGYLDTTINAILKVEETVGPNNQINSYDSARAVSWHKTLSSGSRVFYTSLGHANSNYTNDSLFIRHIQQAMDWCLNRSTSIQEVKNIEAVKIYPNPAEEYLFIGSANDEGRLMIYSLDGKLIKTVELKARLERVSLDEMKEGLYIVEFQERNNRHSQKLLIK